MINLDQVLYSLLSIKINKGRPKLLCDIQLKKEDEKKG